MPVDTKTPVIEAKELGVAYNGSPILDDVSFTIKDGEYVAIIGPNGAGKTTLLKVMLGLIRPSHGSVKLFDQDISSFQKKYQLGYIPQRISSSLLRFPATVEEVVRSGRTARLGLFARFSQKDEEKIAWAMDIADVEPYKNRPISDLSGGELQRVFIARALAGEPKLLFLDEPTVGVDLSVQEKFYAFLQELNKQYGLTILIVTHEVDIAIHRAQYVICLNRRLICHIHSSMLLKGNYLEKLYGSHTHIVHHEPYEKS